METRGSKSRRSSDEVLDSGLYCDFPDQGRETAAVATNIPSSPTNNSGNGSSSGGFGGALRRFMKKGSHHTKSKSSGSTDSELKTAAAPVQSSTSKNNSINSSNNNTMTTESAAVAETAKSKPAAKPRRRRGSHMMPEGGGKMPTSAELMAQKEQQQQQQQAGAVTQPTTTTATKSTKPRRRRGSHAMPEGGAGGGQKLPTSAELMAQKQQQQQQQQQQQAATEEDEVSKPVTMKMGGGAKKSSGDGRRRGSHMMPGNMGGGQKMPTSAELMAQKQQQQQQVAAVAPSPEPMDTEESIVTATTVSTTTTATVSTATTTAKKKASGGRRRGSHAMPDMGGQKMPTSAELMAQKQQQAVAPLSSVPQDMDEPMSGAVTIKMGMSSGSSTPKSTTSSTPGAQMHQLSVDNNNSMNVESSYNRGPSPMDTSDSPPVSTSPTGGRPRARRRGSVVKTMVDSGPKNVDGDGDHVAKSGETTEAQSEAFDASMRSQSEGFDSSMMSIDTTDENGQRVASANKRPALKQTSAGESSRTFSGVGESTRNFSTGGKKKDRGRKAIREVAADMNYVHKVVPKSNETKSLIYDAIKPNILFRACSPEELYDLVDAFEPQYVPMGSVVIQEGDEGDHFYVMEKGGVDVFEKDEHKCTLHSGVAFGEIALLYSCPRTATVQAKHDCKLWVINRRAFRGITAQHKKRRLELKSDFLRKVKIHDKVLGDIMKSSEINSMALATKVQKFKAGNAIVRQGERGDAFYMIEEGKVDVYIKEKGARPIVTLQKGSFFGEKALLSSDTRTATCVASTDVKCLLLMREDFVLMLGNLQDLLDRSYIARDEALQRKESGTSHYPTTRRFNMDDYVIKRTLGVGAFGFVKLVQWKKAPKGDEDQWYALKCVSKQKIEQHKQQEKIKREEDIMKELVHPFIARLYSGMEDEKGKYFLMEALCGGELCELLYNETQFSERWSLFYSASVLVAFGHMHERKIAYRDLKPENLVLDTFGYVKIVDFGLAKKVKSGQTYTFCGTPDYLAPEVILNEGYDWGVDYWGLGVLIYEMTAGVAPFYAESPMEVSHCLKLGMFFMYQSQCVTTSADPFHCTHTYS